MLFSMYIIKDRVFKIQTMLKLLKKNQEDISTEKSKVYGYIYDISLALEESAHILSLYSYNDRKRSLLDRLSSVKDCKTVDELSDELKLIINIFEDIDYNKYDIRDTKNSIRYYSSYDKISQNFVKVFAELFNTDRKINVFNPECRRGEVLKAFKDVKENSNLYGIESDNYSAEQAKRFCTKVIKGDLKGSRIKNDAFDVLIYAPTIKATLEENMTNGNIIKAEKNSIQNIIKYIRPNGVVLIGIPFYRMYKDICEMICRNFNNIKIIKGIDADIDSFKFIYIIGQKKADKEIDENDYKNLRKLYNYDNAQSLYSSTNRVELNKYKLPNQFIDIDLFRGSVLDMEEIYSIVESSGCMDLFFKKQQVQNESEVSKQPLLPFNIGQIGLVLTSGCLDGIIDEGDGNYHVIKGRVSKKVETTNEIADGVLEREETTVNKVEINVFLPNGEFKTLT